MSFNRQTFKNLADNLTNKVFADFRKPFAIQQLTETPDGQGGYTVAWSEFAAILGFAKVVGGGEVSEVNDPAVSIDDEYMVQFSFEYIAGVTDSMRVLYDGKTYNIKKIVPLQEVDVWLVIDAERTSSV